LLPRANLRFRGINGIFEHGNVDDLTRRTCGTHGTERQRRLFRPDQPELDSILRGDDLLRLPKWRLPHQHDRGFVFLHRFGRQHDLLLHRGCGKHLWHLRPKHERLRRDFGSDYFGPGRPDRFDCQCGLLEPDQFELDGFFRGYELQYLSRGSALNEHDGDFLFQHRPGRQHQLLLHRGCGEQRWHLGSKCQHLRDDLGSDSLASTHPDWLDRHRGLLESGQFELGGVLRRDELLRLPGRRLHHKHDRNLVFEHGFGRQHQLLLHRCRGEQRWHLGSKRQRLRDDLGSDNLASTRPDGSDRQCGFFEPDQSELDGLFRGYELQYLSRGSALNEYNHDLLFQRWIVRQHELLLYGCRGE
jgi:hypothetical protein